MFYSAYLHGESLRPDPLPSKLSEGWLVVCVEDYPIGWGKLVKGVIKNAYPRGLRWLG
jgi:NOL1/NOP2/fmu family ribosome biogenesis protein